MTTNDDAWDLWMLTVWLIAGVVLVVVSYVVGVVPDMLRILGGFCLVMFFLAIGLEYIKDSNKQILPFLTPILMTSLWLTIILPYVICIPTASIYVDQQ